MPLATIVIAPDAQGWSVQAKNCLFEHFPFRRDALRQAATLARRVEAAGEDVVVRVRGAPGERTREWRPSIRSPGL